MSARLNRRRMTGVVAAAAFSAEGDQLRRQGDFEDAEACYLSAVRAVSSLPAGTHAAGQDTPLGEVFLKLSELYQAWGKHRQAEECFLQSLRLFAVSRGDPSADLAASLDRLRMAN